MDACIKELYRIGIVPVVAIEDANDALPLAEALKKGGVSAIEITFRTEAAAEAIRTLTREMPDMTAAPAPSSPGSRRTRRLRRVQNSL